MGLYKIGDVSKICNISIKALRYYEALGLITPAKTDIYTGYRYYDQKNVEHLYTIQLLKDLNFSLDEIKNYSSSSLDKKYMEIKKSIKELKKKLDLITSLKIQKNENSMKCFVNDSNAIGKWEYICSANTIEEYSNNQTYIDDETLMKELYFLPNGEGYWFLDRWTEGYIYRHNGMIMKYSISDNLLFLETYNEEQEFQNILIFKKIDSKEYKKSEIETHDDIDKKFIFDNHSVGYWISVDYIDYKEKNNYIPKVDKEERFLKSLNLMPNGDCFKEFNDGKITKISWTKGFILDQNNLTASNYILNRINGDDYLIMDWKSGDYVYGGDIYGCYVFKKAKYTSDEENFMEK